MNGQSEQWDILDWMGVISFIISIANYNENLSQSKFQEVINSAVEELHTHMKSQDEKIDQILEILNGKEGVS